MMRFTWLGRGLGISPSRQERAAVSAHALGLISLLAGLGCSGVQETCEPGDWIAAGATEDPRQSSGVMLLPSGRVLVAGGHPDRQWRLIGTSEKYDPRTDAWESTGSLIEPRQGIVELVRLTDGRVLLAGEHETKTGTEVYDEGDGVWSSTGSLSVGRGGHTTTALGDGGVVVAGGINYDSGVITETAERFDPATEEWTLVGSLARERFKHQAVLLSDGRVLVMGGTKSEPSEGALCSAELFDPDLGQWSETGAMSVCREVFTATRLDDGRVLVVGGVDGVNDDWGPPHALAEVFDPSTEEWSPMGSLEYGRRMHTATLLLDGKVLVVGGRAENQGNYRSAELFEPVSGTWSLAGCTDIGRSLHRATLLNDGSVLVVGGHNNSGELTSAERFEPGPSGD
jgi:hypothetical protein